MGRTTSWLGNGPASTGHETAKPPGPQARMRKHGEHRSCGRRTTCHRTALVVAMPARECHGGAERGRRWPGRSSGTRSRPGGYEQRWNPTKGPFMHLAHLRVPGPIATLAAASCLVAAASAHATNAGAPPITSMVRIPGGEFTLGQPGSAELPAHRVRVASFELDVHEVTNAQYLAFCEATDRKLPVYWNVDRFQCGARWPDHPVIGVSQGDAAAYAAWAGKRLPSEAEWVLAARAGGDGRFGGDHETLTRDQANFKLSGHDAPVAVMSYAPSASGLYDMIGNVREWTADRFGTVPPAESLIAGGGDPDAAVAVVDPRGPEIGRLGVVKGGGWYSGSSCQAVHVRNGYPRGWGDFAVGFRCARDLE
ncbi:SUMF1/EgtB/PvdO family nonheme iron enzyme [bacterium]|nr:SUMF1/EgtB/PvdO family nonheme iron enzyme [bacterium]